MDRVCTECGERKQLSAFYLDRGRPMSKCKACKIKYQQSYTDSNKEAVTAYQQAHNATPNRSEARSSYRQTEEGKRANKEKLLAHAAVGRALKAGTLTRLPCEHCGFSYHTEGHHYDYSKPLEVTWLCKPCHESVHLRRHNANITNPDLCRGYTF